MDRGEAEEASGLLDGTGLTTEMLLAAELAMKKATENVAGVMRFILRKKSQAAGSIRLEGRAKTAEQ